jgi:hypothetical protein
MEEGKGSVSTTFEHGWVGPKEKNISGNNVIKKEIIHVLVTGVISPFENVWHSGETSCQEGGYYIY